MAGDVAVALKGSTDEARAFVGVWAKDAAGSACYGNIKGLADGATTAQVNCGGTPRTIKITQKSANALEIDGVAMSRCTAEAPDASKPAAHCFDFNGQTFCE